MYFVIIVEFFKFYHGLKNHYNWDDVIKKGKYFCCIIWNLKNSI